MPSATCTTAAERTSIGAAGSAGLRASAFAVAATSACVMVGPTSHRLKRRSMRTMLSVLLSFRRPVWATSASRRRSTSLRRRNFGGADQAWDEDSLRPSFAADVWACEAEVAQLVRQNGLNSSKERLDLKGEMQLQQLQTSSTWPPQSGTDKIQ